MALQRLKAHHLHLDTAQRRAETRTKIQLGGLLIKSGLTDLLNIHPGDDMQHSQYDDQTAILLGLLLEAKEDMNHKQDTWQRRGRQALLQDFLNKKAQDK